MTRDKERWSKVLRFGALFLFVAGVAVYGAFVWQENKAIDEIVSPGLTLINYTDKDVYASVHYIKFPSPGDGAGDGVGPHAGGGGLICCVPIPARWRPGIKMIVWYSHKDWQPESGISKIVELPEYPDGDVGDLYLIFHSETDFELVCSRYSPTHAKWPGRRVEKIIHGVQ